VMLPQNSVTAFAAGQLDIIIRGLTPQEITIVEGQLGNNFVKDTELITLVNMVVPNNRRKPFDDVRVRKALSLAIDRRGSLEPMRRISNNTAFGGFIRPGYEFALSDGDLERLPGFGRDIAAARAEARRLLAEAGQSNLRVKVMNLGTSAYEILGQFVIPQLQAIGLAAEQEVVQAPAYAQRSLSGDFDIMIDTNLPSSDDPILVLAKYLPEAGTNYGKIGDPKLTELFNQQKAATNPSQRKQLVNSFDRLMLEQAYAVPMFWSQNTSVYRTYVKGWKRTSNFNGGYELKDIWFDK
jgi:peptide/nickel transport system substrate-binding protein